MKFKVCGIRITLNFGFVAVLTLCFLADTEKISLYSFISAVLHECGHLIYLISASQKPKELCFSIFGMKIIKEENVLSYAKETAAALSGPAVNLCLFALCLINEKFLTFSAVNLCLGVFNLLPAQPLDGGTAVHYYFCSKSKSSEKTESFITYLTAIILIFFGIFVLIKSRRNFMLILVGMYIVFYNLLPHN